MQQHSCAMFVLCATFMHICACSGYAYTWRICFCFPQLPLRTPLLDNSWEALCLNACTLDVMLVNTNSFVIPGMNFVGKAISKIVHCCLQALQYEPGLKEKGPTTGQNLWLDPVRNEKTALYTDIFQHPFRAVSRIYISKLCLKVTKKRHVVQPIARALKLDCGVDHFAVQSHVVWYRHVCHYWS